MLLAVHYRVMEHLEVWIALKKLQTSHVLHNSIVHAKAWTNC